MVLSLLGERVADELREVLSVGERQAVGGEDLVAFVRVAGAFGVDGALVRLGAVEGVSVCGGVRAPFAGCGGVETVLAGHLGVRRPARANSCRGYSVGGLAARVAKSWRIFVGGTAVWTAVSSNRTRLVSSRPAATAVSCAASRAMLVRTVSWPT